MAARRHLVLVGGGHTHVHVLKSLAMKPPPATRITLISPSPRAIYSGMVPGSLVGLYGPDDGWIDVAALAARANASFLPDRIVRVAPEQRLVETEERGEVPYDLLSLDVGSRPLGLEQVAGHANVIGVKPVEEAAPRIKRFLEDARARRVAPHAVVVGGGAGGVEVAFALRSELRDCEGAQVGIVERQAELMSSASPRVQRLVARLLPRHGVTVRTNVGVDEVRDDAVVLSDGTFLAASLVVWASGAEGLPFLRASGLPVDERGFLLVDGFLRSVADTGIFAAGDCARMQDHPDMPRAGVYAVRQGPILARNLRVALDGGARLRRYRPQSSFLSLLSTGERRAVLSYRGMASHGRVWWWLKDWIDRRFIEKYAPPREDRLTRPDDLGGMDMAPCGGCAAKVAPSALRGVLSSLAIRDQDPVLIGLSAPDDAAVLRRPDGRHLVTTVDAFPPFIGDLFSVGEIAAVNAASDVHAMGGEPTGAMIIAGVSSEDGRASQADLFQLVSGARRGLDRMGIALVGGHSLCIDGSLVGFAVLGNVEPDAVMTKGGGGAGDLLILTKPLGTAVILAASRAGACPSRWTDAALHSMREPNAEASRLLREAAVHTCTDVSGFGLIGHLAELLHASRVSAEIWLDSVPALAGARELLACGWRSSADEGLRASAPPHRLEDGLDEAGPDIALLRDPQTSGGLLAAVSPPTWVELGPALARIGVQAACIGVLLHGEEGTIAIRARRSQT